jgi:hypothetical protein
VLEIAYRYRSERGHVRLMRAIIRPFEHTDHLADTRTIRYCG